ncbi:MAG TPA: fumarylacetoacetate hydrolase family protein [Anaerolineaceae bacterium]|nr:fumarylacetoacetate hydrolase family protein [Anaerolineaceae bacterium]
MGEQMYPPRRGVYLTRHWNENAARWAADGKFLPRDFQLGLLLQAGASSIPGLLAAMTTHEDARGDLLAPIEPEHETWAAGVTYLRSRDARVAESNTGDIYQKVYQAERPELFFKGSGERTRGNGQPIRVRRDSAWNVPEPELVLAINQGGEIVGYTAGDDVSSRSIEAENPLYLPQAKLFNGSSALGGGIVLCPVEDLIELPIRLRIERGGAELFYGTTSTGQMKRTFQDLVHYLFQELDFSRGVFLFTGTGIIPPDDLSLQPGDRVEIQVGQVTLENPVE